MERHRARGSDRPSVVTLMTFLLIAAFVAYVYGMMEEGALSWLVMALAGSVIMAAIFQL
jgi:hypothetical protein